MFEAYDTTFIGLWLILATILVQAIIATIAHRGQDEMIPGVLDAQLGHESFVFRSDRTFRNSLENIVPFFGLCLIAILTGFSADKLAITVWVFALARIVFTALYYRIATEKNPSPRSYFFIIGFLATFYLMIDVGIFLIF